MGCARSLFRAKTGGGRSGENLVGSVDNNCLKNQQSASILMYEPSTTDITVGLLLVIIPRENTGAEDRTGTLG